MCHGTIFRQAVQGAVWRFFFLRRCSHIEIKINKEIRNYQESIFFGLSLRQFLFSALAVGVAVAVYFGLKHWFPHADLGWACVLAAFPFALGGFFQYNGMHLEQFVLAFVRTELLYPQRLVFRSENLYAKVLEKSTLKEVLSLD